jgi:hypothetical protein
MRYGVNEWVQIGCACCSGVCGIHPFLATAVSRQYSKDANASAGFKPIVDEIQIAKTVAKLFYCSHGCMSGTQRLDLN